eukprot:8604-Heterococcus_DN1.PRE.2
MHDVLATHKVQLDAPSFRRCLVLGAAAATVPEKSARGESPGCPTQQHHTITGLTDLASTELQRARCRAEKHRSRLPLDR